MVLACHSCKWLTVDMHTWQVLVTGAHQSEKIPCPVPCERRHKKDLWISQSFNDLSKLEPVTANFQMTG